MTAMSRTITCLRLRLQVVRLANRLLRRSIVSKQCDTLDALPCPWDTICDAKCPYA